MADPVEAAVARLADEDRRRLHDAIAQWHDDVTITSFGTAREANAYAAGAQEVLRQLTVKLDGRTCSCPTDDDSPLDGFFRCPVHSNDRMRRLADGIGL